MLIEFSSTGFCHSKKYQNFTSRSSSRYVLKREPRYSCCLNSGLDANKTVTQQSIPDVIDDLNLFPLHWGHSGSHCVTLFPLQWTQCYRLQVYRNKLFGNVSTWLAYEITEQDHRGFSFCIWQNSFVSNLNLFKNLGSLMIHITFREQVSCFLHLIQQDFIK